MTSRELEWFDLETRMRELLHNQLVPVITKSREDRELLSQTKAHCSKLETRVKQLEVLVFGDKDHETVIREIYSKYAETEGNRKRDVVRLDQELSFVNEKMKQMSFSVEECSELIHNLSKQIKIADSEIDKLKIVVEHNKESVMKEMDNIGRNFRELNANYVNISLKAEEKALTAYDKSKAIALEIGVYKRELESMWKSHNEMILLAKDTKVSKLNIDEFHHEVEKIDDKFKRLQETITRVNDEFFHRDTYIDKYFPMKVATMISDYLHYSLDIKHLKRLVEYENYFLMELNKEALNYNPNTREIQVQRILDSMKHVEDRKAKLMRGVPKKEKKPKANIVIENLTQMDIDGTTVVAPPKDLFANAFSTETIEDNVIEKLAFKIDLEIKRIKQEMQTKVETASQVFKSTSDQNMLMVKQVLCEISDLNNEKRKEKAEIMKEIVKIKGNLNEHKILWTGHDDLIAKITKMLVCVVEASQIQQALDAQDEEDRHNMTQNIDKDLQNELIMANDTPENYSSSLPSAVFSLKKNCLSCGHATSMLSGIRTSVVYHPTPLFYREKIYQRPELISIKGRLIKTCWDASQLPYNNEEIEPLFNQASQKSRMVSMNESTKTGFGDSKDLPFFNLSQSRNRSKNSRFRIRSSLKSAERH